MGAECSAGQPQPLGGLGRPAERRVGVRFHDDCLNRRLAVREGFLEAVDRRQPTLRLALLGVEVSQVGERLPVVRRVLERAEEVGPRLIRVTRLTVGPGPQRPGVRQPRVFLQSLLGAAEGQLPLARGGFHLAQAAECGGVVGFLFDRFAQVTDRLAMLATGPQHLGQVPPRVGVFRRCLYRLAQELLGLLTIAPLQGGHPFAAVLPTLQQRSVHRAPGSKCPAARGDRQRSSQGGYGDAACGVELACRENHQRRPRLLTLT